jgi:hypothetical protein
MSKQRENAHDFRRVESVLIKNFQEAELVVGVGDRRGDFLVEGEQRLEDSLAARVVATGGEDDGGPAPAFATGF